MTTIGRLDLTTFDGVNVNPSNVVVAFTMYGDANLEGGRRLGGIAPFGHAAIIFGQTVREVSNDDSQVGKISHGEYLHRIALHES